MPKTTGPDYVKEAEEGLRQKKENFPAWLVKGLLDEIAVLKGEEPTPLPVAAASTEELNEAAQRGSKEIRPPAEEKSEPRQVHGERPAHRDTHRGEKPKRGE